MGLFKKDNLSPYEVSADDKVEKFEYNGKYYDIVRYVKQCEADLRLKTNSDKVKIGKNAKKTEKKYLSNKNAITYIDYAIGKQLADGAEVLRVSAVDVKNNT